MTRRKQGLGLFGLLAVAALGVMAFASSAQAAEPLFNVGGLTNLPASIGGVKDNGLELLLVPGTTNLEIKCSEFEVIEGSLLTGGVIGHAKLLYKNCIAFSIAPLEELTLCHVSDVAGGDKTKLHITAKAILLPIEFADGGFGVLAEKIVAIVNFVPEKGCLLPTKNEIKGEVCFRITEATNDTAEPLIESSEAIQKECPEKNILESTETLTKTGVKDKLLFGTKEAYIDGKAKLKTTTEPHLGKTLGVLLL